MHFQQLEQTSGPYRLGRHVLHDPRSRAYDALELARPRPLVATHHQSVVPPWDQGQIGSCTANAALGALMTDPLHQPTWNFDETDAQNLYREETRLDDSQIPGHWEPDDTGSTGLWSMKALKAAGFISGYRHAFRFSTVLHLLLDRPVSTGTVWYRSMFDVDKDGVIQVDPSSGVAGGHQYLVVAIDPDRKRNLIRNSWGTGWALGGYAWLNWDDQDALLADQGDAVVPVV